MAEKIRLDVFLTENGYCESREKAKAAIMAGDVYVAGKKALKSGDTIAGTENIEVRSAMEFVSRGGYKLKKAVGVFPISLAGKTCMDIGASTGGFTDCMLKNGAAKVYCVDVGYGQLAWKIRSDERVVNLERTNIRYVTEEQIPEKIDFASADVSFISLTKVLPAVVPLLAENAEMVCLIKPQFEAGREKVGKKGVVRDKAVHVEVIEKILEFVRGIGFTVKGLDYSPIKGPEGNIEYLVFITRGSGEKDVQPDAKEVVEASHAQLDKEEKL